MKLLLLHGPAISSSRKKLSDLKAKFDQNNVVVFEEESGAKDIPAVIQTINMFDNERLVILENPPEDFTSYTLHPVPCTLVFWFDHEVKKIPEGLEVLFFPEEKEASMFPLLDCLGNKDVKAYLELKKRNETSPNDTQYILTMVFYLLRSLVVTPKTAKDFVRRKNEKMRANFKELELINLYKSVLEIDFKIKSGLMEIPQAEFLLVNLFCH